MQMEPGLDLLGNPAARERHLLLPSFYILLASCSLFRTSPLLLLYLILLFPSPIIFYLLFFSSLSLFFFFFFAVAVVATPVSGSSQPAIVAALVLRAVIRMFVVRELVSLSMSSSRRLLHLLRLLLFLVFSPPFPRRHVASLVAVRTVRSSSIARLAKTKLCGGDAFLRTLCRHWLVLTNRHYRFKG